MMQFAYLITAPDFGELEIVEDNNLKALQKAAEIWQVRWQDLAMNVEIKFLRKVDINVQTESDEPRGDGAGDSVLLGGNDGKEVPGAVSDAPHTKRRQKKRS